MNVQAGDADVIVVGAGPAGSTAAYYLARSGLDVLMLDKASFPRDKVCGDGLTPRAVRQLVRMGVDTSGPGWIRNKGLRIIGGGMRLHLPWPELTSYPNYGLVRTRLDFDHLLARHAEAAGARLLESTNVTAPLIDERSGTVVGVRAKPVDSRGRASGAPQSYRARLVVAADGTSSRLATALGIHRRDDRPLGVAVRTYYKSPRHDDEWMESWLQLSVPNERGGSDLLPGYGWIFGTGNGTSNVGLGIPNTSRAFGRVDYRDLLRRWVAQTPREWGFTEENQVGGIRSAALPMGFNRQPHYSHGVLLVGDSGGMVNPFNGEGIDYAMEAASLAATMIADALARDTPAIRERVLQQYAAELKREHGGYFTLGRTFLRLIGDPRIMKIATNHGLPRPWLMQFTLKLLANLTDHRDGDVHDRVINTLTRVAPAA
ncbi:geranylgeranyl reductase family protein [Actinobacteria bacterium YIM 96077]|uniref:FAD-dependent oxidoreductase n=1 Tax=Phytoactinopolyspora halophila TaxID=1981511 RepID=A0A329QLD6_9ACTN|nr:geranylgeranyl reductase family protein [Phytoactinopolyspora halophila]AYY14789.1 geranylgeranyl reductase family protein [Actinobacteria bacterium YIM 96077]RAW13063.1 FAD-dependent oxidoreductase [Phytoactinopolyspora halophila]